MLPTALVLAALMVQAAPAAGTDRAEIVALVQTFFDGIAARDAALMSRLFLPGAQVQSVREDGGQWVVRTLAADEASRSIAANKSRLLERMWNPEVRVHGRIATLAAPYDFHADGVFSHCGTDAFQLVKTPDGWRFSGVLYTVERQGCSPSPLGPPR